MVSLVLNLIILHILIFLLFTEVIFSHMLVNHFLLIVRIRDWLLSPESWSHWRFTDFNRINLNWRDISWAFSLKDNIQLLSYNFQRTLPRRVSTLWPWIVRNGRVTSYAWSEGLTWLRVYNLFLFLSGKDFRINWSAIVRSTVILVFALTSEMMDCAA